MGGTQVPEIHTPVLPGDRQPIPDLTRLEAGLGVACVLVLLCLRWFYVSTQPWDSDEPQHLHIVWAWANGLLPYKDVFDNHSPLFQAMSAPLFSLLGERADIVAAMRWTMLPIAAVILLTTYWIGTRLFSPRIAFWGALLAASFPDLYAKFGEYRPDLFWAALWLVSLAILISGRPDPRRLFAAGVMFGVAFAVSMKTTFLLLNILVAGLTVWTLGLSGAGTRTSPKPLPYVIGCFLAPIAGALIAPILVVAFFAFKGALPQMYYCVIAHNITSEGDPWQLLIHRIWDVRFWLFVPTIAGGLWLAKRDTRPERGPQRLFFLAVTGFFCPLLFTFWPLVSKQDFLPFYPLLMLTIACPLVGLGKWIGSKTGLPIFLFPFLLVCWQLASIIRAHPPLKQTNQKNVQIIADTLNLTHRGETVLDAKGQTIYRARPYYYVFEQITRERVERGELLDNAPKLLIAARTPVVVESNWLTQETRQFVNQNYVSVGSVLVLGKRVPPAPVGHVQFEIAVPEKYTVVAKDGQVSGTLDGTEITGPRDLSAGMHDLALSSPEDSVAIVWSRAIERGYSPFGQAKKQN
jgi:4-amino-4-deoxy-L-arabinose transferase-like glycosyltransferase